MRFVRYIIGLIACLLLFPLLGVCIGLLKYNPKAGFIIGVIISFLIPLTLSDEKKNEQTESEQRKREKSHQRTAAPSSSGKAYLADEYALLGISPTASNAEVKKAFRRKAQAFHPDKVQGTGLDPEFMKFAKEKFQQISNAYDEICKERNIR